MSHSRLKEMFAGISESGKKRKRLYLAVFASILIVSAVIGIVAGVKKSSSAVAGISSSTHAMLISSCSNTLYPDLCYSTVAAVPDVSKKVSSLKDVIILSLNITITAVEKNYVDIKKLTKRKGLTTREKTALKDCLEVVDETLDELREAEEELEEYPSKSLKQHADDLITLMSSAITNQESCLDGFSHDKADKRVRSALEKGEVYVEKMVSNALALIKNMTDTDIANEAAKLNGGFPGNRKLKGMEVERGDEEWPEWVTPETRRLLQSTSVTPNVVVAADGSGDFKTVAAAVNAAPSNSKSRYVIRIKAGVYRENVDVSKKKTNIMFVGDGRTNTIITGSRNVVDGSTTFHSATVAAVGAGFLARDITFQNTAGASKHQAVALRVGSDKSAFYRCDVIAFQDSLYVHSNRQFFTDCFIAGTVDFIFGNAAAVIQNSDIHARRPNSGQKNMVTAQGRTDPNQNTGIVIQKCRIDATSDLKGVKSSFPTYLGRPWKEYSRTVFMQSVIGDVIHPKGWLEWSGNFALDTLTYREYSNTGPGAATGNRVGWKGFKVITSASEAQQYTAGNFVAGASWLKDTGFPFSLGL